MFMLPAAVTSASVVKLLFSRSLPEMSVRSAYTRHRPSAARSTSMTWCRVSTFTNPVASAAAM